MDTSFSQTRVIIIGTLSLLVIMAWIGTQIYHGLTVDRVTPQVEEQVKPLNPLLNLESLEILEQRRNLPIDFAKPLNEQR